MSQFVENPAVETLTIKVPIDFKARVRTQAVREGRTMSGLILRALNYYLAAPPLKPIPVAPVLAPVPAPEKAGIDRRAKATAPRPKAAAPLKDRRAKDRQDRRAVPEPGRRAVL